MFGFSSGLVFHNVNKDLAWRMMFAMGMILPSFLIACAITFMLESPRWLLSKNRDAEAKAILERIYPIDKKKKNILIVPQTTKPCILIDDEY